MAKNIQNCDISVNLTLSVLKTNGRTNSYLIGQLVTPADFFAMLESVMYDNHFDQYPNYLENVLMVLI